MEKKKIKIIINQQPKHFDKSILTPDDFRDAVGAPAVVANALRAFYNILILWEN